MGSLYVELMELCRLLDNGYWGKRIAAEIQYVFRISSVKENKFDDNIHQIIIYLKDELSRSGIITEQIAKTAESKMSILSSAAKAYELICVSHSHIDMNFLWGYDETVSIVLNTFRTMLDLLEEYHEFIFSQSQAAAYHIVEQYDPEMLEEIKQRVKEGRWELTASTWVEADKNLPTGESLSRQILYTKKYLSTIFDIDEDALNIDFEPDTFGHSLNIPEILVNGGVKYYYYCRGKNDKGNSLFKWVAPSGKAVIAYKEPHWYDSRIETSMVNSIPEFCEKTGFPAMMKVYGVGDHGGGPTRRDIERIKDMSTWPVFPSIRFGKYKDYFQLAEKFMDKLPVVKDELNYIFTGCYSSQSKIKKANRMSEIVLNEAEIFSSISTVNCSSKYYSKNFEAGWRYTLFNQFHDIVTGSCVPEVREHAVGRYQEIMAIANSRKSHALRSLATKIDTSRYIIKDEDIKGSISEGAGAGVGVKSFKSGISERGSGKVRVFHIFNSSSVERKEVTEIVIWDWNGNLEDIVFMDDKDNKIEYQFIDRGFEEHWGHYFLRVLLYVKIPAFGYSTYIMMEDRNRNIQKLEQYAKDYPLALENLPPSEEYEFIMENGYLKVTLDGENFTITSLVDKETAKEYADKTRLSGVFRFIEEDAFKGGGNAWIVGRYRKISNLVEAIKLIDYYLDKEALRQFITYEIYFNESKLKVSLSLDKDSREIKYNVECDWKEIGSRDQFTPQLNFFMPLNYTCQNYKYDIPCGFIERADVDNDVPANCLAVACSEEKNKKSLMIFAGDKNAFRGRDNSIALTLIRSTHGPDPYPEIGVHNFNFALCLVENKSNTKLSEQAYNYNHPLSAISVKAQAGELPSTKEFISVENGSIIVSSIKVPEKQGDNKRLIIRVYEAEGQKTNAKIDLYKTIKTAYFVDINETPIAGDNFIKVEGTKVCFEVSSFSMANIFIEFEQ